MKEMRMNEIFANMNNDIAIFFKEAEKLCMKLEERTNDNKEDKSRRDASIFQENKRI